MWEGDQSVFIPLWASDVSLTRSNDLSHLIQLTSISDCVHHSRKHRLPLVDVRGNEASRANTKGGAEGVAGKATRRSAPDIQDSQRCGRHSGLQS